MGEQGSAKLTTRVATHLANDLNTPGVIAELHALAREAERGSKDAARELISNALFLGLPVDRQLAKPEVDPQLVAHIEAQIAARLEARKVKDWALSDQIRDELAEKGIQLKDAKDPDSGDITTTWQLKS